MAHFVFQCTTLLLLGDAQKGPRLTSRSKLVGETDWAMSSRRPFQVSVFVSPVLSKRKSVSAPHSVRDTQRHVCLPDQLIVPPPSSCVFVSHHHHQQQRRAGAHYRGESWRASHLSPSKPPSTSSSWSLASTQLLICHHTRTHTQFAG